MRGPRKRLKAAAEVKRQLPPLNIPTDIQSFEAYFTKLKILEINAGTHFYFDTSFLVWLTAVSNDGRAEFQTWLDNIGQDRIHIPVWAAHEYLRHHVTGLISNQLSAVASNLQNTANDSYAVLRPYLDTPVRGEHRPLTEFRTSVRNTLIDLKRLASFASKWSSENYRNHVNEIFQMINEYGIRSASVFENLNDIEVLERSRYTGRIPPGFKDEKKKEKNGVGSNSFGDLEFWREILRHAKETRAKSVVILSNDRKNDWLMGAQPSPSIDYQDGALLAKTSWNPIPRAHPMLSFEARASAGVEELVLTDAVYLAAYFKKLDIPCESFFYAAMDVELPDPLAHDKANRKSRKANSSNGNVPVSDKSSDVSHTIKYKDGPDVIVNEIKLNLALNTSGKVDHQKGKTFIAAVLDENTEAKGITDFFQVSFYERSDTSTLVWIARTLVSRSQAGDSLAVSHCSDLLRMLDELPLGTATCIYFGFLAGIYFDGDDLRAPPAAPIFQEVLALQARKFAELPNTIITEKFAKLHKSPFYKPNSSVPGLSVIVNRNFSVGHKTSIIGLQIGGFGLLEQAQPETRLTLSHLLGGAVVATVRTIVEVACNNCGFPIAQIIETPELDLEVEFGPTIGLITPSETILSTDE